MPGTAEGGRKTAITNKARHGEDFYINIGAMGGKVGHTGGFYANRELARIAGAKGGRVSKRGPSRVKITQQDDSASVDSHPTLRQRLFNLRGTKV